MSCTDSWDAETAGHEGIHRLLICFRGLGKLHISLLTKPLSLPVPWPLFTVPAFQIAIMLLYPIKVFLNEK